MGVGRTRTEVSRCESRRTSATAASVLFATRCLIFFPFMDSFIVPRGRIASSVSGESLMSPTSPHLGEVSSGLREGPVERALGSKVCLNIFDQLRSRRPRRR